MFYEIKFAGYHPVTADSEEEAREAFNTMMTEDYPSIEIDNIIEVNTIS